MPEETKLRAWIGDAILHYHIRCMILARFKLQLGWIHTRIVNNENLKRFGIPRGFESGTAVEAEIYRLHIEGGNRAQKFCEDLFQFTIERFRDLETTVEEMVKEEWERGNEVIPELIPKLA